MPSVKVRGLKRYKHPKTGIVYTYHRASGRRIKAAYGTAEFFLEIAALDSASPPNPKVGTLKAAITAYKASDRFTALATRTRADYEGAFAFLAPLYSNPIHGFTRPVVAGLRDRWRKQRGRRFVNLCLTVLSLIFDLAVEQGVVSENPVRGVKNVPRDKACPAMNRPWTARELRAVWLATGCRRYRHLRLPFALGRWTGLREADVLRLPANAIKTGVLRITTAKRGVEVSIPVLPGLARAIAGAPRHDAMTLCASSRGQPWTQDGFRASWGKMMRELRERGLIAQGATFHGLRHSVASGLAERGAMAEDIASVLGQRSSKMAAHYAKNADRSRRTAAVINKLLSTPSD